MLQDCADGLCTLRELWPAATSLKAGVSDKLDVSKYGALPDPSAIDLFRSDVGSSFLCFPLGAL